MDLSRPMRVVTPTLDGDVLVVLAGTDAPLTGRQVHTVLGRASETGVRMALERAAVVAEKRCIVGSALGVPMHARLVARTRIPREEPVREMVRI